MDDFSESEHMEIELISQEDDLMVVRPNTSQDSFGLDLVWTPVLDEFFLETFPATVKTIRLDLQEVNYFDSSILWKIVHYTETLEAKGISLELGSVNEHIMRILNLTRLVNKIKIAE